MGRRVTGLGGEKQVWDSVPSENDFQCNKVNKGDVLKASPERKRNLNLNIF